MTTPTNGAAGAVLRHDPAPHPPRPQAALDIEAEPDVEAEVELAVQRGRPETRSGSGVGQRNGPGRLGQLVIWLPGLAVAVGAAVATAHGLYEVALAAGVAVPIAWLYPLITDGLALVAYTATARLQHPPARRYAWAVVVLAAGLSGLAQAAYLASGATLVASPALRFGVGAWPAVAAAIVAHLLYLLATHDTAPAQPGAVVPPWTIPPTRGPDPGAVAAGDDGAQLGGRLGGGSAPRWSTGPVQSAVQPVPFSPTTTPSTGRRVEPAGRPQPVQPGQPDTAAQPRTSPPPTAAAPAGREASPGPGSPARERARAAAARYADRHSALPTVSELETLARVSRGTAATALKALREQPDALPLITNTPHKDPNP